MWWVEAQTGRSGLGEIVGGWSGAGVGEVGGGLSRKVLPGFVVGHTVEVVAVLELACSCAGWGEGCWNE